MAHGHGNSAHYHLGHIQPRSVYRNVLIVLLILTFITVFAAQVDLGRWNIALAMGIASLKAGVVALYFMHLRYESPVTWMYVAIPLVILVIMIGGVYVDTPFRTDPPYPDKNPMNHEEAAHK